MGFEILRSQLGRKFDHATPLKWPLKKNVVEVKKNEERRSWSLEKVVAG